MRLLFLFFLGCTTTEYNYSLSTGNILPIKLPIKKVASVKCDESEYPFFVKDGEVRFIISEGYRPRDANYSCFIKEKRFLFKRDHILNIQVTKSELISEELTVDPKRIKLSPLDQLRVNKENIYLKEIYKKSSNYPLFDSPFYLPERKVTSIYGTGRLFNREIASFHSGMDFRYRTGEEILSIGRGKVVVARDLFFLGNAVIIDHGLSIFSIYGHLSKINVNEGEIVDKKVVIGLSGASGRVTGPHLHLGVQVNGELVNPNEVTKLDSIL